MTRDLIITGQHMEDYRAYLQQQERAKGTVEQYLRAVANLRACLRGRSVEATGLQEWKTEIVSRYRTATANAMIAAVNGFLSFCGCPELKLKSLRCQQRLFRITMPSSSRQRRREMCRWRYCCAVSAAQVCG